MQNVEFIGLICFYITKIDFYKHLCTYICLSRNQKHDFIEKNMVKNDNLFCYIDNILSQLYKYY